MVKKIDNSSNLLDLAKKDEKFMTLSSKSSEVSKENLSERINAIYGSAFKKGILPIDLKKEPYTVSGFTGNLSLVKKRQGEQYIFLNGRYIKNRLLNSSIYFVDKKFSITCISAYC